MKYKLIKKILCLGLVTGMMIGVMELPADAETANLLPVSGAFAVKLDPSTAKHKGYSSDVFAGANKYINSNIEEVKPKTQEEAVHIETVEDVRGNIDYPNLCVAIISDAANVRSAPSEDGEPVGKIYPQGVGTVVGQENGWVHIQSGNVDGYVRGDLVSVGDVERIDAAAKCLAQVKADALKIRSDMSTESKVLDVARNGQKLVVADETTVDPNWIKVYTEESTAYVASEYVDVSIDFQYAETKEEEQARLQAASINAGVDVANYGLKFVGNPYVWGGTSLTKGADCSGFVMSVYAHFGVGLPHSSAALRGVGRAVSPSEMRAGDIVCYSGHVGICIGNGMIVHAASRRSGIKTSSAYYRKILAVRRIF